ncbi:MAG: toll/interleukin-1 receptor domain-containing protein [Anaerolineales bacterium]|nr:toll/interleukin-1 receptor domain-containing protein [Anaerolineales bacterium]
MPRKTNPLCGSCIKNSALRHGLTLGWMKKNYSQARIGTWRSEKAVEAADVILVCLSKGSITKEGYVQRELRSVLDFADYKPEGTLYIIPVRLEECEPPRRLRSWQYADYFEGQRDRAFQRLLVSLKRRAMKRCAPKRA